MNNQIHNIPLAQIKTAPQVRTKFSNLLELGEDIKKRGLLQPIVVTPEGDGFRLVIGERRFRAMQLAGCESAPAIVAAKVSGNDLAEVQLIENIQREDLSAKDLIAGVKDMYDKHKTVKAVAGKLNKSMGWVSKKLAIALQAGPLTMRLIEAEVKDGELLYAFAKLETIDTAVALDLVDAVVGRTVGRKEVQAALKTAAAGGVEAEEEREDTTGDLFKDPETPSAEEVVLKKMAELIEIYAPKGASASEKPYMESKKSNDQIRKVWEEAGEALEKVSQAK